MGKSTFELAMLLMKWVPLWLVDKMLLLFSWLIFGDIQKFGLKRPKVGPLELKNKEGKTPVLDIGALEKIRSGKIKVIESEIKSFNSNGVFFMDGNSMEFDAVILATGYRSNVPSWLQVSYNFLLPFFTLFLSFFSSNLEFTINYMLKYVMGRDVIVILAYFDINNINR